MTSISPCRRPIRVLFLLDHLVRFGGAERLVFDIARLLDPRRFRASVCATRSCDPVVRKELEATGVSVVELNRSRRFRLDQWWPLIHWIRQEQIDVVHAHKFGSNAWAAAIRRFVDIPVVVAHEHVWSFEGQPVRRFVDRKLIQTAVDATLTVSEHTRRAMIEVEGLSPEKVRVFVHGVDVPPPRHTVNRDEFGLPEHAFVAASVAVLRPQKALEHLVHAAALARREVANLTVLIVGEGPERRKLESLVVEQSLEDCVRFLGHRDDVQDILQVVDVCVSSSIFEGSPLAVMEYMAAGRATVATAVGGVPEIIDHGRTGLLVEPASPTALAAAIVDLARDPQLRTTIGETARAVQRAKYDLRRNVRDLEEVYGALLMRSSAWRDCETATPPPA